MCRHQLDKHFLLRKDGESLLELVVRRGKKKHRKRIFTVRDSKFTDSSDLALNGEHIEKLLAGTTHTADDV